MAGDRRNGDGGYTRPRIWIAIGLSILLSVLLLLDAVRADYDLSELTLTVLLGGILTLLGLEITDIVRGGKP